MGCWHNQMTKKNISGSCLLLFFSEIFINSLYFHWFHWFLFILFWFFNLHFIQLNIYILLSFHYHQFYIFLFSIHCSLKSIKRMILQINMLITYEKKNGNQQLIWSTEYFFFNFRFDSMSNCYINVNHSKYSNDNV